jgi:hypothetical protein
MSHLPPVSPVVIHIEARRASKDGYNICRNLCAEHVLNNSTPPELDWMSHLPPVLLMVIHIEDRWASKDG